MSDSSSGHGQVLKGNLTPNSLPVMPTTQFKDLIANAVTPVSVVSTDGPHGRAGFTCSAVCTVSDSPPTILVCVHQKSAAYAAIKGNGVLCVNLLRDAQSSLSQAFAGVGGLPMIERFAGGSWGALETAAPVLEDALLSLDCRLLETREVGTHCILLAEVVAGDRALAAAPLIHQRHAYATATQLPVAT